MLHRLGPQFFQIFRDISYATFFVEGKREVGILQLPHLTLFPQITELDLSSCEQLTDEWLPLVAFNTQLRSLSLAGDEF